MSDTKGHVTRIPDALNAAQMIRDAGYIHPAEVIEEQHAEIERLRAQIRAMHSTLETITTMGDSWSSERAGNTLKEIRDGQ